MSLEEFKEFLKESGLPKEFSSIFDQIIRVVNNHEERLDSLERRSAALNKSLG